MLSVLEFAKTLSLWGCADSHIFVKIKSNLRLIIALKREADLEFLIHP